MTETPLWFKRPITLGMTGPDVRIVRRKLGFTEHGPYDRSVQTKVLGLARKKKIQSEGEVTEDVAEVLGPASDGDQAPSWYVRDLQQFDAGEDVRSLNRILGINDDRFREDTEAAIRRLQSSIGESPTGKIDEALARRIGSE